MKRSGSALGTVIGLMICGTAIVGTVFLDWTWENPDGNVLPLLLGVGAAIVAVVIAYRQLTI